MWPSVENHAHENLTDGGPLGDVQADSVTLTAPADSAAKAPTHFQVIALMFFLSEG